MSMNSLYLKLLVCAILAAGAFSASAQKVAMKTNIVQDALLDPNIGVEIGLAPKWTLDVTGQLNAWTIGDGHRWKHWLVQPEARYWFCERFAGHFLGFHASADNTTSAASATKSPTSSAATSQNSPTNAIRAGERAQEWHTATHGLSTSIGTWKPK